MPDRVQQLCDAGMDSFRFSLNSVREDLYNRYYRPKGYTFADVLRSVKCAKANQRFTMINYLVSPGVSDAPEEVEALLRFVADTGVDMIQMRNLSIDPGYYNREMGVAGQGIGMYRLLQRLKAEFPRLQFGYYNRTRENFFPPGFETGWPIAE
jgi:pyruvate-formate lyase-activating enzyme